MQQLPMDHGLPHSRTNIVLILWLIFQDHFHQPHLMRTDRNRSKWLLLKNQTALRWMNLVWMWHCTRIESNWIKSNWLSIEACISTKRQVFRLAFYPIELESFVVLMPLYVSIRSILHEFSAKCTAQSVVCWTEMRFNTFLSPTSQRYSFLFTMVPFLWMQLIIHNIIYIHKTLFLLYEFFAGW